MNLVPSFGTFFSCLVVMSVFKMIISDSSYFSHVSFLSLTSLFFSNERQKQSGSRREGRKGGTGRTGGGII